MGGPERAGVWGRSHGTPAGREAKREPAGPDPSSRICPLPSPETQVPADPEGTQPLGGGARGGHALQLTRGPQQHAQETHPHHRGDHDVSALGGRAVLLFTNIRFS